MTGKENVFKTTLYVKVTRYLTVSIAKNQTMSPISVGIVKVILNGSDFWESVCDYKAAEMRTAPGVLHWPR